MTEAETATLRAQLAPLVGQKAWGVAVGHGSFLTLEFGAASPRFGGDRPHGEWHLWLMMTAWRIDRADAVVAASEDDRVRMQEGARALDGAVVAGVDVIAPAGDLTLRFGDATLRTFAVESNADDWRLFTPGNTVLHVGAAGWREVPANSAD